VGSDPARSPRPARRAGPAPRRLNQSIRIAPELRQRLRLWAAYLDKEISTVVEEAVTAHLDALDRDRAARGLAPMPRPESEGGPPRRRRRVTNEEG
jgi:hypothetical protein